MVVVRGESVPKGRTESPSKHPRTTRTLQRPIRKYCIRTLRCLALSSPGSAQWSVIAIARRRGLTRGHGAIRLQTTTIANSPRRTFASKDVPSAGFEPTRKLYRIQTPQPRSAATRFLKGTILMMMKFIYAEGTNPRGSYRQSAKPILAMS